MKKVIYLATVAFLSVFSINCATIISGRTQDLPVTSTPSEAIITIGSMKQVSPATFMLDRRQGVYVVKVEKEGYQTVEVTLRKGVNGWVFGNIIFGGLIGLVIDVASGSASKFTPTEIDVNLAEKQVGFNNVEGKDILFVKLVANGKEIN